MLKNHFWKKRALELSATVVTVLAALLLMQFVLALKPNLFYRDKPFGLCEANLGRAPNWVSSLVHQSSSHHVASFAELPFTKITSCIEFIDPKTYVVELTNHLEGFRRTALFGFTDWFCIERNGNLTSAATLGYTDLGRNRKWVERIRQCVMANRTL